MSTKTEIQSLIDSDLASASSITATEHRNVLNDDADSLLNNLYADVITDTTFGVPSTPITTSTANFKHTAYFCKTGRKVSVNGSFVPQSGQIGGTAIFTLDDAEFYHTEVYFGTAISDEGDYVEIQLSGNSLVVNDYVASGETFRFEINYNTTN